MSTKHKHYDVIIAFAEGKTVQCEQLYGEWKDCEYPNFSECLNYRVKPGPKKGKYRVGLFSNHRKIWTVTLNDRRLESSVENESFFVRWLTPWVPYEV